MCARNSGSLPFPDVQSAISEYEGSVVHSTFYLDAACCLGARHGPRGQSMVQTEMLLMV